MLLDKKKAVNRRPKKKRVDIGMFDCFHLKSILIRETSDTVGGSKRHIKRPSKEKKRPKGIDSRLGTRLWKCVFVFMSQQKIDIFTSSFGCLWEVWPSSSAVTMETTFFSPSLSGLIAE